MNKQTALAFFSGLLLLSVNNLLAQDKIPNWKVDSLLQILERPSANYEFNFNFSFSDLDKEETPAYDSLANMSEEELRSKLTGKFTDAEIYGQLVYRGLEQGNEEKILSALQKGAASYEQYINSYPEDSIAVQELASMMLATQNYDFAMKTLDYGVRQFPTFATLHASRFQTLFYNLGQSDIASNYIDSLLQVFPNDATIAYFGFLKNYGQHMEQYEGKKILVDTIMQSMNNYLQQNPDEVKRIFLHHFCKAYLYMNIKVIKADENEIETINTVISDPKGLLKEAYIEDLQSFVDFLNKAEKEKRLPPSLTSKILAMCHVLLGKPKEAEKNLIDCRNLSEEEAGKAATDEALTLLRIVQVEESENEVIEIVKEKYKRTPNPKDLVLLSIFYLKDKQPEKALEFANEVTEKYPEFGAGWEMKAYLELQEKDFATTSLTLARGEGKSSDPIYYFLLKIIHLAGVEGESAANESLQALLDAQPEHEKGLAFRKLLQ